MRKRFFTTFIPMLIVAVSAIILSERQRCAPVPPLPFASDMLSEAELIQIGHDWMVGVGMQGEPTHEAHALMTISSFEIMSRGTSPRTQELEYFGLRRSSPRFVYQVLGDFPVVNMFSFSRYNSTPNYFAGLFVAIDPYTGFISSGGGISGADDLLPLDRIPRDLGAPPNP